MGKPPPSRRSPRHRCPTSPRSPGVRFATAEAGIRYKGRTDLLLALLAPGTTVAGVLTRSKTRSAPVDWCAQRPRAGQGARAGRQFRQRQRLHRQEGPRGGRHHRRCGGWRPSGCTPGEVFIASTGVIGEPLEAGKFAHLLGRLAGEAKPDAWHAAARADHDHRHLPQARHAHAPRSAAPRSSSTASARAPA